MAGVTLPLDPGPQARVLLNHILEHGDILGPDCTGQR